MTPFQQKAKQLEDRTVSFSIDIIKTCGTYSGDRTLQPLIRQIIKSATSIGANYAEVNNASSRADFRNKIYIAKKEAAETRYWLRVLNELLPDVDLSGLMQEARELNLIMQKIISTMKASNEQQNGN